MTKVLLQTLSIAALGLLAPGSITLVILFLMSGREGKNGIAFMFGYIATYSALGATLLTLDVNVPRIGRAEQSAAISFLLIGFAILFLVLAIRNWMQPPPPEADPDQPTGFARLVNGVTPRGAFGVAFVFAFANLKNLAIFLATVSKLLRSDLNLGSQLLILIPAVFVFCLCVMVPVGIFMLYREQSEDYLNDIKDRLGRYSRPLGIGLTVLLSLFLFYRGFSGLL